MIENVTEAIRLIQQGHKAYFKFIAANETGDTGGHQCGYYIPRDFLPEAFDEPCIKGRNNDKWVRITWNGIRETRSRFIYYGVGTRDEARVTNFGRGFEFLKPEYTGAVLIFVKESSDQYAAFVLNSEEEIDEFLGSLALGPTEACKLIQRASLDPTAQEREAFASFISRLSGRIPSSVEMSEAAREIENAIYDHAEFVQTKPDEKLLCWSDVEYRLFRALENDRYGNIVAQGFASVDDFLKTANTLLNSRKSRAGKSLEHHLAALFSGNNIQFEEQIVTEGNKRPDFIFPSSCAYHDASFDENRLFFMAAKTTCKDRWRQILCEADRFRGKTKYLCTLQQGMSERQIQEMQDEQVALVVPKQYKSYYPARLRSSILSVSDFIKMVKERQT